MSADFSMPSSEPNTADPRATALRNNRRLALGLLLAAGLVFIAGAAVESTGRPWGGWLRAFGEAAAVGGLADWFAVVALFRHPLGMRWIPHTAIIPRNKDRIATSLAEFVRDNFLEPEALLRKLQVFDPAARLAQWLTDPARVDALARHAQRLGLEALQWLDDDALRLALKNLVLDALRGWDAAQSAGQILSLLTRDGRHQQLLDEALGKLGEFLGQPEVKKRVSDLMVKYARQEWPTVISLVDKLKPVDSMGDYLADKLAQALMNELAAILKQADHPVRVAYDLKAHEFIERLRTDPVLQARVREIKQRTIDHPSVQGYVEGLVHEVREWLRLDLARTDSLLAGRLRDALAVLGARVGADPQLRASINEHVVGATQRLVASLRGSLTEHIIQTVRLWDDVTMVRELDLAVGKDLQYIRLNGTLVGGLVGILLHGTAILIPLLLFGAG